MEPLRRSVRINFDYDKRYKDLIKHITNLLHENNTLVGIKTKINNISKIYKLLNYEFYFLYQHEMKAIAQFYKTTYLQSFIIFRDNIPSEIKKEINLYIIKYSFPKELLKFRKKYENFLVKLWGLNKWKIQLPIEIIKLVLTYV